MANSRTVFDRLAGLETEYALRFRADDPTAERPSNYSIYSALVSHVAERLPTVPARNVKQGVFLANGGHLCYEAVRSGVGAGLIEGATPECRGPLQLLLYQRALDRIVAEAAAEVTNSRRFRGRVDLVKNDRDSQGNVYGAQENYEVVIASGWRLTAWRAGLLILLPVCAFTWLLGLVLLAAILFYLLAAAFAYLPLTLLFRDRRRLAVALFGRDLVEGRETDSPFPPWLELTILTAMRIFSAPLALGMWLLVWLLAFRDIRRRLGAFFASRPVISGSGLLDAEGRFQLSDKAPALNCVVGFNRFLGDRPLLSVGHFFKTACFDAWFVPREYFRLFAERQRLQVCLGDSNMADTAEYLRIGTTLLVLDALEAGALEHLPRARNAIRQLHTLSADAELRAEVTLSDGRRYTALAIQELYAAACRRFLEAEDDAPSAAWELLARWEQTLKALAGDSSPLVGVLDWVTKRFLLEETAAEAPWEVRKKIDLRYHELSKEGYYRRLEQTGVADPLIYGPARRMAIRTPPPDSPATARGRYIREFGQGAEPLSANWNRVCMGRGFRTRVIPLARYVRARGKVEA